MTAVMRPETVLHCTGCEYHDESWRFKAMGGDVVVHSCPRCGAVASLNKPAAVAALPIPTQAPKEKIMKSPFVVVNYTTHTMQVMDEQTVFNSATDLDADLVMPMLSTEEIGKLPRHVFVTFQNQFSELTAALEAGDAPALPEVVTWIESLGKPSVTLGDAQALAQDDQDEEDEGFVAQQEYEQEAMDAAEDDAAMCMEEAFTQGFSHGFQAGFTFATSQPNFLTDLAAKLTPKPAPSVAQRTMPPAPRGVVNNPLRAAPPAPVKQQTAPAPVITDKVRKERLMRTLTSQRAKRNRK